MGLKKPDDVKQQQGLALLISSEADAGTYFGASTVHEQDDVARTVKSIFELDKVDLGDGDIDFASLIEAMDRYSLPGGSEASTSASSQPEGRLGPQEVLIDKGAASGRLEYYGDKGLAIESSANFSSCRATCCVFAGKWMYEVTLCTAGIQQIGWCTINCPFTVEEGVGDAEDSYAFDGKRVRKWSVRSSPYGQSWAPGDVIGCCVDLEKGELSFYRNGQSLGVAYNDLRVLQATSLAYFPAMSLSFSEKCELNFGSLPFKYPVEGYQPLQLGPKPQELQQATYLTDCLKRLILATVKQPDDALPNFSGPKTRLDIDTSILLAAAIWTHLQHLFHRKYFIASHLVPLLLDLHHQKEPHRPDVVLQLVRILEAVLNEQQFAFCFRSVLEHLGSHCCTAPLSSKDFPYTAAYPYVALGVCITQHMRVKSLWVTHEHFMTVTEAFLTRKAPSPDDLKVILPNVWWKGTRDETCSEERLKASMQALALTVSKVETKHYELLTSLIGAPPQRLPGDDDEFAEGADQFLLFVRRLLQKNAAATRNIPPPGLSDQTALISAFFVLLKLLRPYIGHADRADAPLATFPAADMFAKVSDSALWDASRDLPRLGGIQSHLLREEPLSRRTAPLPLLVPRPLHTAPPLPVPPRGPAPAALPELLNAAMLLYSWRVVYSLRSVQTLTTTVNNNTAQLEHNERQLAGVAGPPNYLLNLQTAITILRQDIASHLRLLTLLKVVFFSGWKQETLWELAVYSAALLTAASEAEGPVLSYVPVCYVEVVLEVSAALRRSDAPFASARALAPHGMHTLAGLLVRLLGDKRIKNPDVKEELLQCMNNMLEAKELLEVFESSPDAQARLVPAVMEDFDSRLWHPLAQILLRLVRGTGFGQRQARPGGGLSVFQRRLQEELLAGGASTGPFLHKLLSTLNWAATEFAVAVKELHEARSHGSTDLANAHRKAALMFELAACLLRVLEFVGTHAPQLFLAGPGVNLTRVLEMVSFVLSHLTVGADARHLNELLQASALTRASAAPAQPGTLHARADGRVLFSEKVSKPSLLAPVVGLLLGLWAAEEDGTTAPGLDLDLSQVPGAGSGDSVEQGLRSHPIATPSTPTSRMGLVCLLAGEGGGRSGGQLEALRYLVGLDWSGVFPGVPLAEPLRRLAALVDDVAAARTDLEAGLSRQASLDAALPDEFLDPITMTLMTDPVTLPDSAITVDRSTIERHLLTSATDPFSRAALSTQQLRPNDTLRDAIQRWLSQPRQASGGPQRTSSSGLARLSSLPPDSATSTRYGAGGAADTDDTAATSAGAAAAASGRQGSGAGAKDSAAGASAPDGVSGVGGGGTAPEGGSTAGGDTAPEGGSTAGGDTSGGGSAQQDRSGSDAEGTSAGNDSGQGQGAGPALPTS